MKTKRYKCIEITEDESDGSSNVSADTRVSKKNFPFIILFPS